MRYDLPRPTVATLIIQCALALACAICLYLFLTALQTKKSYATAIITLTEQQQGLTQAAQKLDDYEQFISADPFYQCTATEPQWEKMAETWVDLPYDQLLQRLTNLYRADRPFVVDFFAAARPEEQIATGANTTGPAPDFGQDGAPQGGKLVFKLQGYFLCPCR